MWKYYRESKAIYKTFKYNVVVYNNALVGLLSVVLTNHTFGMINDDSNATVSLSNVIMKKEKLSKRLFFHYIEKSFCYLSRNPIIVNSDYLKNKLNKEYGIPNNKFIILHKGIEKELINQNRVTIIKNKHSNSILFTKTDFIRGGLFLLIEALKTLQDPIKLGVVGVSVESLSDILQSISSYPQIDLKVYGIQPQLEVYRLMREYEIFCVPSYKEAFGVANLEALSCGCKIVSTEVGGIPEALHNAPLKWLVPPGNVRSLANAIKESFSYEITDQNLEELNLFLIQYSDSKVIAEFLNIFNDAN
jgi:glycosyltransferase involved in cell wall biosynthesis